ncbi:phosphate ABC transporter membrane protein 1, PhoT family [Frankineae bacterium MT45]|nr:phosphate ABC transporter membrane protein 1, PhoT family [Frankineae bacterium MT45]
MSTGQADDGSDGDEATAIRYSPDPGPTLLAPDVEEGHLESVLIGAGGTPNTLQATGVTISGDGKTKVRLGDRIFSLLAAGSGLFVVLLIGLVALFLVVKAFPAIADDKANFLTSTKWDLSTPGHFEFGIAWLLWVTVIISLEAMIIAVPIAVCIALYVSHYAPKRIASSVAFVVNLLAAVPSIIYGLWGFTVFAPAMEPVQRAFYHLGGVIPIFKYASGDPFTIFIGGIVLAIMILPIITAVSRDVFERTPRANVEAALALGATRWEMIRMAVLPYGRAGVTSGAMLGLGRALGETIAVLLILHVPSTFSFSIMQGGLTFASRIALDAGEMSPQQAPAYIAAGLVLFVLTFVVNAAARAIVNRKRDFV